MTSATTTTHDPLAEPSDEALAPRLAARDEAAVALLVERWWARAYGLALQLVGDAAVAEDVAQDAFVQALRGAAGYDPARGAFAPWFLRIVRNAAFNAARARARRTGHEAAAARPDVAPDDPADQAAARLDAAGVRAQLARLSPQYREAVALHCLQGLTFQEVAHALGCPLGTVASRVRRGLDTLRARLATASPAAAPLALPATDADLVDRVARAFADAPAPAAPPVEVALSRAAAAAPPTAVVRAPAPARWTTRAGTLLALAVVLAGGTAAVSLVLRDPLAPPPRQVVVMQPPPAATAGAVALTRPATPTTLVVPAAAVTTSTTSSEAPPPGVAQEVAPDAVEAVACDAGGERVAAGRRDGTAEVWDLRERALVHRLDGHRARVTAAAFTPAGALVVTASYDGTARVWETASGSCVHVLEHATTTTRRRVLGLALSPDGRLALTAGEDGHVRVWALAQGELLRTLEAHARPARAVCFDLRGQTFLSAGEDHRLVLWSAAGERLLEVASDAGFSHALLDRDGAAIAAGAPLQVERFDLQARARVAALRGEGPLALSPPPTPERDRGLLLRAGAGVLRLVDVDTGAEKARLVDDDDVLLSCALTPDGRHALTGGESGRIKVWDLHAGTDDPPSQPLVRPGAAGALDRPDHVVVEAGDERFVTPWTQRVLPTPPAADLGDLRRRLTRATRAERRELLSGLDARDAGSFRLLLEALAGGWSDWTVRDAAVVAVARLLGDPRVQAAVARALDARSTPPGAREGLTLALGLTRSQAFLGRLLRSLEDPAWVVRRAAAIALTRLRDARSIEPLIRTLAGEVEPRAAALEEEALELITGADPGEAGWAAWWDAARRAFEVPRRAFSGVGRREDVEVDRSRRSTGRVEPVTWSALVRGHGPPVLVLADTAYKPDYLTTCLRWLERERTVAYVSFDHSRQDDATVAAARLERLRRGLVERGALADAPEVVVAHGLAGLIATRYARARPAAAGLLLVSPFSSGQAWDAAVKRLERDATRRGDDALADAARMLLTSPARVDLLPVERRAAQRRDLFTSYFADPDDLLIGHLLGPRREEEEFGHVHELERLFEPAPPRDVADTPGWHEVPIVVLVGRATPWDSVEDAERVARQSRRGHVVVLDDAARMPFHEQREAFVEVLRALSE